MFARRAESEGKQITDMKQFKREKKYGANLLSC